MKRIIFFTTAALCVISVIIIHIYKEKYIGRYVHIDGFGLATDATKFVVSGEYYFDCQRGWLVRRIPLRISADEVRALPNLKYERTYNDELDAVYEPFFADPAWPEGFTYVLTFILKGPNVVITSHFFEKIIQIGEKKFIMSLTQGVHMKGATIYIETYAPKTRKTYEQYREQAKNSCSESQ